MIVLTNDSRLEVSGANTSLPLKEFDPCSENGYLPTTTELYEALGTGGGVSLYTFGALNFLLQAAFYFVLVKKFWGNLENERLKPALWITSIYMIISLFNLFSLIMPPASDFLWLAYKVYVGTAMGYFVDLTLDMYGGETAMINDVGEDTFLSYRKPPCCCCFCLPKKSPLTKNKIRLMRASVYQIPYTDSMCLILLVSLQLSGYVGSAGISFYNPHSYISVLLSVSFIFGIWGLFMFFNITQKYNLLSGYRYNRKSTLMKLTIIIINFQAMIIDTCNRFGGISCMAGK
eukprot:TRINITY_DN4585_c0_g1_i15.p1 TRINITY_DN4585_c0_g1~~TRINITY_DN4585_c0_g1_i15.p1  ORF type:complete len:289 (-),score=44.98 TRINITY_DN4585_c0_g1_i15:910-1776(-)